MEDFSIELKSETINDPKTKAAFREVFSSYVNGNYRSAVVMLWTVVVCDLVYKLQYLRDLYNDVKATGILDDMAEYQVNKPNSPEWESQLVQSIHERTNLLDTIEYQNLVDLQKKRHLSAHPIFNNKELLYSPNKETVRALIRNSLEGVLIKPPLLTKEIVPAFVQDLSDKSYLIADEKSLKRYLEVTYFNNLHITVYEYLFKAIWKFVFNLINTDTEKNLNINYCALKILYKYKQDEIKNLIQNNKDYFSKIDETRIELLIYLLYEFPAIFPLLKESTQIIIRNAASTNIKFVSYTYFLHNSLSQHIDYTYQWILQFRNAYPYSNRDMVIPSEIWEKMILMSIEENCQKELFTMAINLYTSSFSFDQANIFFDAYIDPILDKLDSKLLMNLLEGIENNNQTTYRRDAKSDHRRIKERCSEIADFDFTNYPEFIKSFD